MTAKKPKHLLLKRGRKVAEDPHCVIRPIRLTRSQEESLTAAAKKEDVTVSEYVRRRLFKTGGK